MKIQNTGSSLPLSDKTQAPAKGIARGEPDPSARGTSVIKRDALAAYGIARGEPDPSGSSKPASSKPAISSSSNSSSNSSSTPDLRNVKPGQIFEVANGLYQSGKISFDEAGALIASGPGQQAQTDPSQQAPLDLLQAVQGQLEKLQQGTEQSATPLLQSLLGKLQAIDGGFATRVDVYA